MVQYQILYKQTTRGIKMDKWESLLSDGRIRSTNKSPEDGRNEFERDYDRIVYSSAFRRLQDKAQVFPLEMGDYVRTRLTHSLEVASLGRSMGVDVARKLVKEKRMNEKYKDSYSDAVFSNILSSACLIHDIGNPPFGHFGETAIQDWFKTFFQDNLLPELTPEQKLDFMKFEGNAQAFRILTRLQFLSDEYGLNLSYATLATLMKYPRSANEVGLKRGVSYKKHGYFQSESDQFSKVKAATGMGEFRHPLAFLLEAADDIAYSAADVEDGLKKGVINWDQFMSLLESNDSECVTECRKAVKDSYDKYLKVRKFPEPQLNAIQNFRICVQSMMLRESLNVFLANIDAILEGQFDEDLIGQSKAKDLYKLLIKIGVNHVYNAKQVLTLEVAGYEVIKGLLDMFVRAMLSENYNKPKTFENRLYQLISPNFRYVFENWTNKDTYAKIQLVTDFVSGMTDFYALDLYQKLSGNKMV